MRRFSLIAARSFFMFSLFIFKGNSSYAQYEELVNYRIEINEGMPKALDGTFQILIDPKYKPVFTNELLYFIEQNRADDKDVWIQLMPCAELYIPSRQRINSVDFVPLNISSN